MTITPTDWQRFWHQTFFNITFDVENHTITGPQAKFLLSNTFDKDDKQHKCWEKC